MNHSPEEKQIRICTFVVLALIPLLNLSAISFAESPIDSLSSESSKADLSFDLDGDELEDHERVQFADWLIPMPGYYPLDQGGFGQPMRGRFMGLPSWIMTLNYRERKMDDHLLGSPELNWVPPGSVTSLSYSPFSSNGAALSVDAGLRVLQSEPPSSRLATRDGYYRLGYVDFDIAEKVIPSVRLNGGGRIATYNGRLPHSESYGLNLRAEAVWWDSTFAKQDSSGLWGWWGIMQNRRKAEVPYGDVNHNTERYESDLVLHWHNYIFQSYAIQQRETYGGGNADSWDEIGINASKALSFGQISWKLGLNGSYARWKLKGMGWSTTSFGDAKINIGWQLANPLFIESAVGMGVSDDFDPKSDFAARFTGELTEESALFCGMSQQQRFPSRFETSADYEPGEHYLPYDPVFYQQPDLPVHGADDLKNEQVLSGFVGGKISKNLFEGSLAYCRFQMEDPICWRKQGDFIVPFNAENSDAHGALGWLIMHPMRNIELGGTGSYLPLDTDQQRLTPEVMLHSWVQYKLILFNDNLDLRFRLWENYWGKRHMPIPGGWETAGDALVISGRISARLYGFRVYWGIDNMFDEEYEFLPGYLAMHKEEVWGISWNFID